VASQEFTVLFLYQDGSTRITAGARLKELQAGYNVKFDPHFDSSTSLDVPTGLDLVLLDAKAGFDNSVNFDSGGNPIIGADNSKPGVDGFFSLYQMTSHPDSLTPAGPAPAASEYTPTISFLMGGFKEFSLDLQAGIHIFGLTTGFLDPFVSVSTTLIGKAMMEDRDGVGSLFIIAVYVIGASTAAVKAISYLGRQWRLEEAAR